MNFTYDKDSDALAINLMEDAAIVRTEQIDSGTLVDLDRSGEVVAIEVIHPARRWPLEEVEAQFNLSEDQLQMLNALWKEDESFRFPFAGDLAAT